MTIRRTQAFYIYVVYLLSHLMLKVSQNINIFLSSLNSYYLFLNSLYCYSTILKLFLTQVYGKYLKNKCWPPFLYRIVYHTVLYGKQISIVDHISWDSWCFKIFCPLLRFFRNPASLGKCSTPRFADFIKERSFLKINSNLCLYFKPVSFLYIL